SSRRADAPRRKSRSTPATGSSGRSRRGRCGMALFEPLAPRETLTPLQEAIMRRESDYLSAIDRLREIASDEDENQVYSLTSALREAITLVGCLRRLVADRSVSEIHRAFGAPGDFGYETLIGDALYRTYQGEP